MRVSVVIPCYNAAPFVERTLASVRAQTLAPHEVIVVDDGSSDGSAAVVRRALPSAVVIEQPNGGVSRARNAGVARAIGDSIAFLDADDCWRPDKLARQADYLDRHPEAVAVLSGMCNLSPDDVPGQEFEFPDAYVRALSVLDFLAVPVGGVASTLVVRAGAAARIRFPEDIGDAEDLIYTACLRALGPIGSVGGPLMMYRRHATQRTNTDGMFSRSVRSRLEWCDAHWPEVAASRENARAAVLAGAVSETMGQYWARDMARYRLFRRQLLALWPEGQPRSHELDRVAWPAVVLKARDWLGRRGRAKAGTPADNPDARGAR
jgi:glycosyltransferase involved in cell wall biosynthesis